MEKQIKYLFQDEITGNQFTINQCKDISWIEEINNDTLQYYLQQGNYKLLDAHVDANNNIVKHYNSKKVVTNANGTIYTKIKPAFHNTYLGPFIRMLYVEDSKGNIFPLLFKSCKDMLDVMHKSPNVIKAINSIISNKAELVYNYHLKLLNDNKLNLTNRQKELIIYENICGYKLNKSESKELWDNNTVEKIECGLRDNISNMAIANYESLSTTFSQLFEYYGLYLAATGMRALSNRYVEHISYKVKPTNYNNCIIIGGESTKGYYIGLKQSDYFTEIYRRLDELEHGLFDLSLLDTFADKQHINNLIKYSTGFMDRAYRKDDYESCYTYTNKIALKAAINCYKCLLNDIT